MRYRGPAVEAVIVAPLDILAALYHRPSGTTHLLASPAREIVDALTGATLSLAALARRLRATFELDDEAALADRVDELVEAGLVEVV